MNTRSQAENVAPEACWEVLERAALSPSFKRATRLREFLLYVGSKSLQEGRSDIHEQEIGHVVFGRAEGYDTAQDNIVRVSATEMRKRVDAYFAAEGKDEPLIFEIPRGSYAPLFRARATVAEPPAAQGTLASPLAMCAPQPGKTDGWRPTRPHWLLVVLLGAATVALAVFCAILWHQNQALRRQIHPAPGTAPAMAAPSSR